MKKKITVLNISGRIIGILLLITAIFLGITAMTFSFGGGKTAPDIFGFNIYLVKGGDFYQLKSGTAAMAEKAWPDEVQSGEIIIYKLTESSEVKLARVNTATLKEAVMSYEIETEAGELITISQGQYVAKVTHFSDFLGALIGFVMSPFGVMAIALLPCLAIAVFELVKFIISKMPEPEVETVRIQEETPTFIPKKEIAKLNEQREQEKQEKKLLAEKQKILTSNQTAQQKGTSRTDEFTERLKQSDRIKPHSAQTSDTVQDRADFSEAAKRRMAEDLKKSQSMTEEISFAETLASEEPAKASISDPKIKLSQSDGQQTAEKTVGVPDISMVFADDEDKGYDIDDILADFEKKRK